MALTSHAVFYVYDIVAGKRYLTTVPDVTKPEIAALKAEKELAESTASEITKPYD